ncbi:uncharacterized protein EAE98_004562 [Botrytis deweyae]|uniref:Uncharacterized protein n=1 Tax=Botrytis deweyae TaxID=2478750 RepID=A0ABQ7IR83_9HELO|nr:uncharacterized protein EAE98_004562 [Botrytis deweyae]KAF7931826.1 hypothetical protein EAE98_004562 [Botrytis deweyae]
MRLLITLQVLSSVIAAFAAPIHVQTIDDTFVTLPPNPIIKLPAPGFAFKLYMSVYELKRDERWTYLTCFRNGVSGIKFGATNAADQFFCCRFLWLLILCSKASH